MRHLAPREGDVVVDCTVGFGGHASEFLKRLGPAGRLIGLDVDAAELTRTRQRLGRLGGTVSLHNASYARLDEILAAEGLSGCDVILADLGVSSMQVDDAERGVSYKHADSPLDMRMDPNLDKTAADVLATISEEELSSALRELADEPDHEKLAAWMVRQRSVLPMTRTSQLVRLVFDAKGLTKKNWRQSPVTRHGQIHPAAQTFQALRMLVNDELGHIAHLMELAPTCLRDGGRIGVISFHSGEDRIVKRTFREGRRAGAYSHTSAKVVTPRPAEIHANPRSASAKLRWAVRSDRARREADPDDGAADGGERS